MTVALLAQPVALVRRAPTLNGKVEGAIQVMTAENITFNGGAELTGDLLVPGMPTVRLNGSPVYGGTLDAAGLATPTGHTITLNGGAKVGRIVRRTDARLLPAVSAPPQPSGTRSVSLNTATASPGDFATLKHLTLNSNVGVVAVPPGTYGNFTANAGSGFRLGVAGAAEPAVYHFQNLTLNSNSTFSVVGPVVVTVAGGFSTNSDMGNAEHPEWLNLRVAGGGLSLNGVSRVYAGLEAPDGTLTLNGGTMLAGDVAVERLIVNGNALLRLVESSPNIAPTVAITAPANGAAFPAPAALVLEAAAADGDGTVTKVEFYQGTSKLGEVFAAPYRLAHTFPAGTHALMARATDDDGAMSDSVGVIITVTSLNQPPTVTLLAPADGTLLAAPAIVTLTATASDADGSVGKVEFHRDATKLWEDTSAPYEFTTTGLVPGTYVFTATAHDLLGASTTSAPATVTVVSANQPPAVAITAPVPGAGFAAPASFTLAATATDADGTVARVDFFQDGAKIGEATAAPFSLPVTLASPGSYGFVARATDDAGSAVDSAVVTILVRPANQPPTVSLAAPAEGTSFSAPASIGLAATATDADGTVARVEFYQGVVKLGEDATAPYAFTWSGVAAGTYALTARAVDNAGAATSTPVRVVTVGTDALPFLARFEPAEGYQPGSLHGQNGWIVTGHADVVAAPVTAGQQAVALAAGVPAGLAVHTLANPEISGVSFVDFYAQPGAQTAGGVVFDTTAAAVALTGAGAQAAWQVFHGDGQGGGNWQASRGVTALQADGRAAAWTRLTVREDYGAKTWDLYLDGRLIAVDAGFVDATRTALAGFALSGHPTLPTGFDEFLATTVNPLFADADRDGMDDVWESAHGLNPAVADRIADLDHDGLNNVIEYLLGTDPADADTDRDGLPDAWETAFGYDPLTAQSAASLDSDADGDGLTLAQELRLGTDPGRADVIDVATDTDGDGLPDLWEIKHGLDPRRAEELTALNADADGDQLSLHAEAQAGTDPARPDTDGDGLRDDFEVDHGLAPLSAADAHEDPDGDGLGNLQEYARGTDPRDYYNGVTHEILPFIGGDFDLGAKNLLAVRVTDMDGNPLLNAPVILELQDGSAQIALTPDGPPVGRTAEIRTGPGGIARAYLRNP